MSRAKKNRISLGEKAFLKFSEEAYYKCTNLPAQVYLKYESNMSREESNFKMNL